MQVQFVGCGDAFGSGGRQIPASTSPEIPSIA
jgi:hypothetical protein